MGKTKVKERKSTLVKPIAESGSPYDLLGYGPRLKRLTTWEPERWKNQREPAAAGLPATTRESKRFYTWEDRGLPSVHLAYYMAKNLARGNLTMGNFLVLVGPTGVGKTHLALAIAWEWFEDGFDILFSRADELLDWLRQGYDDNTYYKRFDSIRRRHLLVIDDLGTEQAKDWAGEKMDRIIDWRYINQLPLVVTTNAKSEDLAARVASRLADKSCSTVVQVDAPDYRKD